MSSQTKVNTGYTLDVASTELEGLPALLYPAYPWGNLRLEYRYFLEDVLVKRSIEFIKVRAHRHLAELYCNSWHVKDAYDTLVQIENPEWVAELETATPVHHRGFWVLNHYMIYFDSAGSYEIIAESWKNTHVP